MSNITERQIDLIIYILYTPNLGLLITVYVCRREHGRFDQEHEGAAARRHEGAEESTKQGRSLSDSQN